MREKFINTVSYKYNKKSGQSAGNKFWVMKGGMVKRDQRTLIFVFYNKLSDCFG